MHTRTIILYSQQNYVLSEEVLKFCKSNKINALFTNKLPDLIYKTGVWKPEMIIYDGETRNFNVELFDDFVSHNEFIVPTMLIVCVGEYPKYDRENLYYCDNSNMIAKIEMLLSMSAPKVSKKFSSDEIEAYKDRIGAVMSDLGITAKNMGYSYIKDVTIEVLKDESGLKSLSKYVYPQIAVKYHTFPGNIERNIRTALDNCLANCRDVKLLNDIKGMNQVRPSTKQFIAYLYNKIA